MRNAWLSLSLLLFCAVAASAAEPSSPWIPAGDATPVLCASAPHAPAALPFVPAPSPAATCSPVCKQQRLDCLHACNGDSACRTNCENMFTACCKG